MTEFPEVLKLRLKAYVLETQVDRHMARATHLSELACRVRCGAEKSGNAEDLEFAEQLEVQAEDARKQMITTNEELWSLLEPLLEPRPAVPGKSLFKRIVMFLSGTGCCVDD